MSRRLVSLRRPAKLIQYRDRRPAPAVYNQPGATHFDGAVDYYKRDGAAPGASHAASKFLFSMWINPPAGAGQRFPFALYANQYSVIPNFNSPQIWFDILNGGFIFANASKQDGTSTPPASFSRVQSFCALPGMPDGNWHNIIGTIDTHTSGCQFAIDGVLVNPVDVTVFGLSDIPFDIDLSTVAGASIGAWYNFQTGALVAGTVWNNCIAEIWVADVASIPDLSIPANVQKFRALDGKPVSLGLDGSLPTGAQPPWYFPKADGVNKGYAGNMSPVGAPTVCGSHP